MNIMEAKEEKDEEEKKRMKNRKMQEKGITLIALVVTIIVLLILAGISISMLTGQNGILNRASQAKKAQGTSQVEELAKLKLQELYTDNLGVPDDTTVKTAIAEELRKQGYEVQNVTTSNATVKGILIKDADGKSIDGVNIGPGATTKIRVELDVEGAGAIKTYVKINGKYYEINITGTNVSLSTEEYAEIPNGSQENQIKLTPPTDGAEMTVDGTKVTAEKVIENGTEITIKAGSETKTVTFNVKVENTSITKDVNVVVAAIKKVENPASYGTNPNAQAMADEAGKVFALPTGASYVTGTVDTGVVVNVKGSEFVWVPVDDVVLDTSRDADLPKSSDTGTSSGKTYTPMAVQVGNDYKGILYDFSGSNGYLKYGSNANYQGGSSDFREPDVVSDYDGGNSDTVDGKITTTKLTTEYNAMIASVLKYKGFYVARYEAGLDKTTNEVVFKNASVEANNVTTADASNSETSSWYGLYKKIKTFTNDNDKVVSSMIWGSQYDAMLNWMAKNGKTVGDSNSSIRNNTTTTGGKDTDIINNVNDLYGCNYEWTLEANGSYLRAIRGGYSGDFSPAIRSLSYPYDTYSGNSSRATLCIK